MARRQLNDLWAAVAVGEDVDDAEDVDYSIPVNTDPAVVGDASSDVEAEQKVACVRVVELVSEKNSTVLLTERFPPASGTGGSDLTIEMLSHALAITQHNQSGTANQESLSESANVVQAGSADAVVSIGDIILTADKLAVFGNMFRLLKPGGWVAISDVVAEDWLTHRDRLQRGNYLARVSGRHAQPLHSVPMYSFGQYRERLRQVGFTDIDLATSYSVADGVCLSTVTAVKPVPSNATADDVGVLPLDRDQLRRRAQRCEAPAPTPPEPAVSVHGPNDCPPLPWA